MSSSGGNPKVAIPPLARRPGAGGGAEGAEGGPRRRSSTSAAKKRIEMACRNCRQRKVKCDGRRPRCGHCVEAGRSVECVYPVGRRDKLREAHRCLAEFQCLAAGLADRLDVKERGRMEDLVRNSRDVLDGSDFAAPASSTTEHGERDVSAGVGSDESADVLDEDLDRDDSSRATGFVGRNSEVQWLRRFREEDSENPRQRLGPHGPPGAGDEASARRMAAADQRHERGSARKPESVVPVNQSNYHLDDEEPDLNNDLVDPFELPPVELMRSRVGVYMETLQEEFPILVKQTFMEQFDQFIRDGATVPDDADGRQWLAILHLLMAISARYLALKDRDGEIETREHLIHYNRARQIAFEKNTFVTQASIKRIRIVALLSLYYLCIDQVNRADILGGCAVKYCYAQGLHVRSMYPHLPDLEKEARVRLWWCVYKLERLCCEVVGRPSVITDAHCSVPLPLPLLEEELEERTKEPGMVHYQHSKLNNAAADPTLLQDSKMKGPSAPGPPLYFRTTCQLIIIRQQVVDALYSAGTASKSWQGAQDEIRNFARYTHQWLENLHPHFDFRNLQDDPAFFRHKIKLGFLYYSVRILTTRPCVCRLDPHIAEQSQASKDFNRVNAQACVKAAISISDQVPDQLGPEFIYRYGPWWVIVHYFMQAAVILLLEVAYDFCHGPEMRHEVLESLKKVAAWLHALSDRHGAARKGYSLYTDLLQRIARKSTFDLSGLVAQTAPLPPARGPASTHYQEPQTEEMEDVQHHGQAAAEQHGGLHPLDVAAMALDTQMQSQLHPPMAAGPWEQDPSASSSSFAHAPRMDYPGPAPPFQHHDPPGAGAGGSLNLPGAGTSHGPDPSDPYAYDDFSRLYLTTAWDTNPPIDWPPMMDAYGNYMLMSLDPYPSAAGPAGAPAPDLGGEQQQPQQPQQPQQHQQQPIYVADEESVEDPRLLRFAPHPPPHPPPPAGGPSGSAGPAGWGGAEAGGGGAGAGGGQAPR